MRHPSEANLALFAGGDLGLWEAFRVDRHVSTCATCREQVATFKTAMEQLPGAASGVTADVNWNRLAQEMTGNIRVGLAAGEAIAKFDRSLHHHGPRVLRWNAPMAVAAACVLFIAAVWLKFPREDVDRLVSSLMHIRADRIGMVIHPAPAALSDDVVLEASRTSIQVKENGGSLSLLQPHSDGVTVSVSMQGSAGARYVDADTGQVTMNRVYYAQQ